MSSAAKQIVHSVWQRRWSPELWLLASNLLARLLGFVVSLLVSRMLGVQALGMYSGLLITTASPTTPMASALANNATMMAARAARPDLCWALVWAHRGPLLFSSFLALGGCVAMMQVVGLHHAVGLNWTVVLGVSALLVLGQLLTPFIMGLAHGVNASLRAAVWSLMWTGMALLMLYPLINGWGLPGVLWQAAVVAILPAMTMLVWMWWRGRHQSARLDADASHALRSQANEQFRQAMPSISATVLNNATNWLACIYLAERSHGAAGVGLVAIGLQWMALMLLPLTSWNGRVMRALTIGHAEGPQAFKLALMAQIKRCVLVTLAVSGLVAAATPWIADLYRVEQHLLWGLLVVNAVAATLFAVTFVFERACYCLGNQGVWLRVSMVAYAMQLIFTFSFIDHSIAVVAIGNLLAITVLLVAMRWIIWRDVRALQPAQGQP
jgi:O-antigen/teichoic acid export membrane protein